MRIIGGRLRGKRLHRPKGAAIRPTADRIRESVFNILAGDVAGSNVCDLFAGTGALGIESLSRGAETAWFVERSASAVRLIRQNLSACSLLEKARVRQWDIRRGLQCLREFPGGIGLVFLDPPYGRQLAAPALDELCRLETMAPGALAVVEHAGTETVDPKSPRWSLEDRRVYGKTHISFFRLV